MRRSIAVVYLSNDAFSAETRSLAGAIVSTLLPTQRPSFFCYHLELQPSSDISDGLQLQRQSSSSQWASERIRFLLFCVRSFGVGSSSGSHFVVCGLGSSLAGSRSPYLASPAVCRAML